MFLDKKRTFAVPAAPGAWLWRRWQFWAE